MLMKAAAEVCTVTLVFICIQGMKLRSDVSASSLLWSTELTVYLCSVLDVKLLIGDSRAWPFNLPGHVGKFLTRFKDLDETEETKRAAHAQTDDRSSGFRVWTVPELNRWTNTWSFVFTKFCRLHSARLILCTAPFLLPLSLSHEYISICSSSFTFIHLPPTPPVSITVHLPIAALTWILVKPPSFLIRTHLSGSGSSVP